MSGLRGPGLVVAVMDEAAELPEGKMVCATGMDLERAQADGTITAHDADEIRNFAGFLTAAGPIACQPGHDRKRFYKAYADHDPEHHSPHLHCGCGAQCNVRPCPTPKESA